MVDRVWPSVVVHVWCTPAENCVVHGGFVAAVRGGDQGPAVEFGEGVSWRKDRHLACESEKRAIAGDDNHGLRGSRRARSGSRLRGRVTGVCGRPPDRRACRPVTQQLDELDRLEKPLRVRAASGTRGASSSVRSRSDTISSNAPSATCAAHVWARRTARSAEIRTLGSRTAPTRRDQRCTAYVRAGPRRQVRPPRLRGDRCGPRAGRGARAEVAPKGFLDHLAVALDWASPESRPRLLTHLIALRTSQPHRQQQQELLRLGRDLR